MEYRLLGRSGLKVSLHALGTMNFAGTGMFEKVGSVATADAARLVDVAVDHGGAIVPDHRLQQGAFVRGEGGVVVGEDHHIFDRAAGEKRRVDPLARPGAAVDAHEFAAKATPPSTISPRTTSTVIVGNKKPASNKLLIRAL